MQEMRLVLLPQALRVIIPPITSQYLNLTKNSSLAVAVGYPDLVSISTTTLNQTGRAIEAISLVMLVLSDAVAADRADHEPLQPACGDQGAMSGPPPKRFDAPPQGATPAARLSRSAASLDAAGSAGAIHERCRRHLRARGQPAAARAGGWVDAVAQAQPLRRLAQHARHAARAGAAAVATCRRCCTGPCSTRSPAPDNAACRAIGRQVAPAGASSPRSTG